MQSIDYQILFASLEKRQPFFAVKLMYKGLASSGKRQTTQNADYQLHFTSLEK